MKILIVGAGAVGTVYGRYLQIAGAEVSFFVREKYVDSCRQGFHFYFLNRRSDERYKPIEMKNFGVLSTVQEVLRQRWDYVVLAVSSTALKGTWLKEFINATGNAIIVMLQPGLEDREYILQYCPSERLIESMIPIVSYIAPLPNEKVPYPGIAYWFPPGSSAPFKGPEPETTKLIRLFRKGKFPARKSTDVRREALIPSTILSILVTALELSHWSFQTLMRSQHLKFASKAIPESLRLVSCHRKENPPCLVRLFVQPKMIEIILYLSRWVVPFDFETYLRVHFTKVQDQMHQNLNDLMNLAQKYDLPSPALNYLHSKLMKN